MSVIVAPACMRDTAARPRLEIKRGLILCSLAPEPMRAFDHCHDDRQAIRCYAKAVYFKQDEAVPRARLHFLAEMPQVRCSQCRMADRSDRQERAVMSIRKTT